MTEVLRSERVRAYREGPALVVELNPAAKDQRPARHYLYAGQVRCCRWAFIAFPERQGP